MTIWPALHWLTTGLITLGLLLPAPGLATSLPPLAPDTPPPKSRQAQDNPGKETLKSRKTRSKQPSQGVSHQPADALAQAMARHLPFFDAVETRLFGQPGTGPLAERLDRLQTVLYGEKRHHDVNALLAELALTFPEEARLLASATPAAPSLPSGQATAPAPFSTTTKPSPISPGFSPGFSQGPAQPALNAPFSAPQNTPPPFPSPDPGVQEPSTISRVGQGLLQLAGVAGALAGSYYLNRRFNRGTTDWNGYNQPYGYGNPYGYGVPAGSPYGFYGGPYGAGQAGVYPPFRPGLPWGQAARPWGTPLYTPGWPSPGTGVLPQAVPFGGVPSWNPYTLPYGNPYGNGLGGLWGSGF